MNKHILSIMAAAMFACAMTSCSKDGDEITVDRIHTTATADKITIEKEVSNDNIIIIPDDILITAGGPEMHCGVKSIGNPNVTYTSADEKIVTVNKDGMLKGVGEGETTISVSLDGAEKGKIKVSVKKGILIDGNCTLPVYSRLQSKNGKEDFYTFSYRESDYDQAYTFFGLTLHEGKLIEVYGYPIDEESKSWVTFDKEKQILTAYIDFEIDNHSYKGYFSVYYDDTWDSVSSDDDEDDDDDYDDDDYDDDYDEDDYDDDDYDEDDDEDNDYE